MAGALDKIRFSCFMQSLEEHIQTTPNPKQDTNKDSAQTKTLAEGTSEVTF